MNRMELAPKISLLPESLPNPPVREMRKSAMRKKTLVGGAILATALLPGSQKARAQKIPPGSREQSSRSAAAIQEIPLPPPDRRLLLLFYPREMSEPQSPFPLTGMALRFDREHLKNRVRKYEGEVLHPYPDKAGIITIGCGFNMEKHAIDHPDDPYAYNSMQRVDPSGEELWRLADIPENFQEVLASGHARANQRRTISPQSADRLLEISLDQAIHNAGAYFRHFNAMTERQQEAAVYLVYNMGTHLENHPKFLEASNRQEGPDWKEMGALLLKMDYYHSQGAESVLAAFGAHPPARRSPHREMGQNKQQGEPHGHAQRARRHARRHHPHRG
jgi:GH24 family phage-related lysozyme (muramidase)